LSRAFWIFAYSTSSVPWFQIIDRHRWSGREAISRTIAVATIFVVWSLGRRSEIVKPVKRSKEDSDRGPVCADDQIAFPTPRYCPVVVTCGALTDLGGFFVGAVRAAVIGAGKRVRFKPSYFRSGPPAVSRRVWT